MIRIALVLVLASCLQSHEGTVELRQEDCATCHRAEVEATTAPVHRTAGFPDSCADCHRIAGWRPALAGLHPNAAFRINAGPHAKPCLDCHELDVMAPSTKGANTTCITESCHGLGAMDSKHREEGGARYKTLRADGGNRHFCLDSQCHPDGREE